MGGPCCYPRSNKGQTHRPKHTRPLCQGVHTLVYRTPKERECEVHCYLWSTSCRWEENVLNVAFLLLDVASASTAVVFFSHYSLHVCQEHESLNFLGGWGFPTAWCRGIWLSSQVKFPCAVMPLKSNNSDITCRVYLKPSTGVVWVFACVSKYPMYWNSRLRNCYSCLDECGCSEFTAAEIYSQILS